MEMTVDLTDVQQLIIDILHKGGEPVTVKSSTIKKI